jgi:LPXTG-site transpeptidase (sortase) family protein
VEFFAKNKQKEYSDRINTQSYIQLLRAWAESVKKYGYANPGIIFGVLACVFLTLISQEHVAARLISRTSALRRKPPVILAQEIPERGLPLRLKIPSVGINTAIEHLGLTPAGAMDVPKDPNAVGWYSPGPRPGEKGSAVIGGHLDWFYGKTAAFSRLKELHAGDLLQIEDEKGQLIFFTVREIRIFDSAADTTEVFHSASGMHLNLITCAGTWNKFTQNYSQRLVVFTDLVK